ncbi:thermostable beta-glucosidase B [Sodiomyces alkalinus F11]|uniref:Beta-glucosidase cel3A n=1 Tax=Sodiomyces alkalinus (strain CBS 110278 / VKM F-3762 / F11) TaxID=1314773 RepID=A0A3N2PNM1_SODAK|nr:thermostable beta-glucosidase B [Sodiomyces alkalinus F11]ROT36092.1 thermostable beta-glucosidase B [Sodiomyces alkalinus F11]
MHPPKLIATLAACAVQVLAQHGPRTWPEAYDLAEAAFARLSQSEKIGIVTGIGWNQEPLGPCIGNTSPAWSIGYPSLCLHDGPQGIRWADGVTAFTPAVQAASTWDRRLISERGTFLGEEFRGKGIHVILGPAPGPLGKNPNGGRNWEGFSPDPYLQGIATALTVTATQDVGVQTAVKHFIANEQEVNRETISSNVDDRSMHELYLWPFADAIHADATSVMCAYNRVNGTYACENDVVLTRLLKEEMGFPGYVMSDWFVAQQTTAGSANAGMDMATPGSDWGGGNQLWGPRLQQAIDRGDVPQSRLDDMVRRILAAWYLVGQDEGFPPVDFDVDVQADHARNVRDVARDGTVLLKNDDNILPLRFPGRVAVIGSSSVPNPNGINSCLDHGCDRGALGMGWGSGAVMYPYFVAPLQAIQEQARADGFEVVSSATDSVNAGANAARGADVAIVFITANSGEAYITVEGNPGDRIDLDPWHNGNELVEAVAAANENVVVVVHSTGPVILERILAQPNVKAIVWGGLPSQENGNAAVDILWGKVNPNGKLPYTIARSMQDYSSTVQFEGLQDNFEEGLYIDYRHFDAEDIAPRYEFGFGLSFTTFGYSDLHIDAELDPGPAYGDIIPGGRADLFGEPVRVDVTITNTGDVAGAEVPQLYLGLPESAPPTPPKQLRGFDKVWLAPGESQVVTFDLRRKDVSYWDVGLQEWVVPLGTFRVFVGSSSRDIRAEGEFVSGCFHGQYAAIRAKACDERNQNRSGPMVLWSAVTTFGRCVKYRVGSLQNVSNPEFRHITWDITY